ncbi:hypothetical protein HED60_15160 [Planctomycetales bacterium ZRK34]|nr:hypothetical protein HED60_15160 [Planctomycetales bacterium ZRK34]
MHNTTESPSEPRPQRPFRPLVTSPHRRRVSRRLVDLIILTLAIGAVAAGYLLWATKGGV